MPANANWFIGLPVEAGDWLAGVQADAPPGYRLFHPADVHITVAFLGRVGAERAAAAWAVAERIEGAPMVVTLGPVRPFGARNHPSAFSIVPGEGGDAVASFIGTHRDALIEAAGARPDTRPPAPHLTVARPPRGADRVLREAGRRWALTTRPPGVRLVLDRIALYTWAEDRRERQFRIVVARRWP